MQLMAIRERERASGNRRGRGGGPDDGFKLCVSEAVETIGWHHAQQHRRRGELVGLQVLHSAKFGAAQGGEAECSEARSA